MAERQSLGRQMGKDSFGRDDADPAFATYVRATHACGVERGWSTDHRSATMAAVHNRIGLDAVLAEMNEAGLDRIKLLQSMAAMAPEHLGSLADFRPGEQAVEAILLRLQEHGVDLDKFVYEQMKDEAGTVRVIRLLGYAASHVQALGGFRR